MRSQELWDDNWIQRRFYQRDRICAYIYIYTCVCMYLYIYIYISLDCITITVGHRISTRVADPWCLGTSQIIPELAADQLCPKDEQRWPAISVASRLPPLWPFRISSRQGFPLKKCGAEDNFQRRQDEVTSQQHSDEPLELQMLAEWPTMGWLKGRRRMSAVPRSREVGERFLEIWVNKMVNND